MVQLDLNKIGMDPHTLSRFRKFIRARSAKERPRVIAVLVLAVISVTMTVIGPRILGHATNIVFDGIVSVLGMLNPFKLFYVGVHAVSPLKSSRR